MVYVSLFQECNTFTLLFNDVDTDGNKSFGKLNGRHNPDQTWNNFTTLLLKSNLINGLTAHPRRVGPAPPHSAPDPASPPRSTAAGSMSARALDRPSDCRGPGWCRVGRPAPPALVLSRPRGGCGREPRVRRDGGGSTVRPCPRPDDTGSPRETLQRLTDDEHERTKVRPPFGKFKSH